MKKQIKQTKDEKDLGQRGKEASRQGKKQFQKKEGFNSRGKHNDEPHVFKSNDPAWYTKYKDLADNAGRVAFNRRSGTSLTITAPSGTPPYTGNIDPVLQVNIIPNPGISDDAKSAINIMSSAAWKMLNRRFRGVTKYQAADFGIIQYAVLDFFANLAEAERAYGVLNYYSLNNTLVPRGVLLALGIDPDQDLELADYRYKLNRLILSAKTLCLVKGYSLLDHYLFLANNVFKDKESPRAQLFAFVREGFWYFDPTTPNGSALIFKRKTTSVALGYTTSGGVTSPRYCLKTLDDIITDLQYQLSALLHDDDVDNVCSDILAFYGNKEDSAEIVRLAELPEDYVVMPIFSDQVCRQFHNMNLIGAEDETVPGTFGELIHWKSDIPAAFTAYSSLTTLMVYQEDNNIKFNIHFISGSSSAFTTVTDNGYYKTYSSTMSVNSEMKSPYLDTDILSPSTDDVIEMSRYTVMSAVENKSVSGTNYWRYNVLECGTILCCGIRAFRFTDSQALPINTGVSIANINKVYDTTHIVLTVMDLTIYNTLNVDVTRYDWAPLQYSFSMPGPNIYLVGDTENIITLSRDTLHCLHDVAGLSEFKNPIMDFLVAEGK